MCAAANGNAGTVRLLLKAGASTVARDNVSKRISICTYVFVLYILRTLCMISKKYRYTVFLYFIIVICRI